ncbi:MAG: GIY-YIG nuclease family protein, partial [Lentisphaerota bacterium]
MKRKLRELPDKPGVYFMRDRTGRIIYVGKALSLRKRVQSYFRQGTLRSAEPKLRGLIRSIDDFDILVVRTEAEATLTEGRLIKEYRPRYNVDFKDDKRFLLLRVNLNEPFPRFEACRLQRDDGWTCFGPYATSQAAWAALEFIEKRFGLRRCHPRTPGEEEHKHCLNDIVRFCSAPC